MKAEIKPTTDISASATELIKLALSPPKIDRVFDREIALLAFVAHLKDPHNHETIEFARLVAACKIITLVEDRTIRLPTSNRERALKAIKRDYLAPSTVARFLGRGEQLIEQFGSFDDCDSLFDVGLIVDFFVSCDSTLQPSLNKALYFIDSGGFTDGPFHSKAPLEGKVSSTTLKTAWQIYGNVACFGLASYSAGIPILDLRPDDTASIKKASRLLNSNKLLWFFGIAKAAQNILLERLDRRTARRLAPIAFPNQVPDLQINFGPLDKAQTELVRAYKARDFNPYLPGGDKSL